MQSSTVVLSVYIPTSNESILAAKTEKKAKTFSCCPLVCDHFFLLTSPPSFCNMEHKELFWAFFHDET